jgi:molecular chaperone GrpE (heat shock protein)
MEEMVSKKKEETHQTASDGDEIEGTTPSAGEAEAETAPTPEAAVEEPAESVELSVEDRLAGKEAEVADLQNQILYLHSEVENFKKRTEKRYREALEFASEPLLKDFLPALDTRVRVGALAQGLSAGPRQLGPGRRSRP